MQYDKQQNVSGTWAKASEIASGTRVKLTTPCVPSESTYEGKVIKQNIAKARFEGDKEDKNVNVNRPSINGLIDAFGPESEDWVGKILTVHTEKMIVGGKRVTAMYFIPEGYEVGEDNGGYLVVTRKERSNKVDVGSVADMSFEATNEDSLDPSSVPF
jgi:hypothetical protein